MTDTARGLVVRSTVRVPLGVDDAFRLFTARIEEWWPLEGYSVFGERATGVRLEPRIGGRIVERSAHGETSEWGVLSTWDPPGRLAFSWHPGHPAELATRVEIRFHQAPDGGTTVELEHTGWEARGTDATGAANGYRSGWREVLGRYVALASG